jgi:lipid-binding SYLF domain-containing protein
VLTYSRSRGLFAGISLKGNTLRQDKDDTRLFYGRMVPFRTSLTGQIPPPPDAHTFLSAVSKYALRASGKEAVTPVAKTDPAAPQQTPKPE